MADILNYFGSVVADEDDFVDVRIDGSDVRSLLMVYAASAPEAVARRIMAVYNELAVPQFVSTAVIARVHKNILAAANEKPPEPEK